MKRGNSYVLALAVAIIMTAVTVNMCALDAYAKTEAYEISVCGLKDFKKTNNKLKVVSEKDNEFYITEGDDFTGTGQTKKTFALAKNCKWTFRYLAQRDLETGPFSRKSSYKEIKKWVDELKELPNNGYYGLSIHVNNGKVVKIVFSQS